MRDFYGDNVGIIQLALQYNQLCTSIISRRGGGRGITWELGREIARHSVYRLS